MPVETRIALIRTAAEAAIILSRQLNYLLDAFDFFSHRYEVTTASELLERTDLLSSIQEVGQLAMQVSTRIQEWRKDQATSLDPTTFEIDVLNELNLHMNAMATFMFRKGLDLEPFDAHLVGSAFLAFRDSNRLLT